MTSQNYLRSCLILLTSCLLHYSSVGQRSGISIGPTLSLDDNSLDQHGRKGLGASLEFYYKLYAHGGLRFYSGYDRFNTPKITGDEVSFIGVRAGYQHFLAKDHFILWGDAGIAELAYPAHSSYAAFSFSSGGGYNFLLRNKRYVQVQAYYTFIDNTSPYFLDSYYSWFTVRAAYGIGFGRKRANRN
jgi:hypothetical protein